MIVMTVLTIGSRIYERTLKTKDMIVAASAACALVTVPTVGLLLGVGSGLRSVWYGCLLSFGGYGRWGWAGMFYRLNWTFRVSGSVLD